MIQEPHGFWKTVFEYISEHRIDLICITIFALVSTVVLTWFDGHEFIWGGDANYPMNAKVTLERYKYVLDNQIAFGRVDVNKFALLPFLSILWIIEMFNIPISMPMFQHLLIWMLAFFMLLNAYILARVVMPNSKYAEFGAMVAGFFYLFNVYSMITIWTPLAFLMFHYAFMPLVLALYIYGLENKKSWWWGIAIALISTYLVTPAYVTPSLLFSDVGLLGALFVYWMVVQSRSFKSTVSGLYFSISLAITWLALNLFWLLPMVKLGVSQSVRYSSFTQAYNLSIQNAAPLEDAFRLAGYSGVTSSYRGSYFFPWWDDYMTPALMVISMVIPVLAFSSLCIQKRNRYLPFFGLVAITALFLVKGHYPPHGELNEWIYSNQNVRLLFRSVYQRFMVYVTIAYVPLIAVAYTSIFSKFLSISSTNLVPKNAPIKLVLALFLTVTFYGVYAGPALMGERSGGDGIIPAQTVTIPKEYHAAAALFDSTEEDFFIFELPYYNRVVAYYWWNNGNDGYKGLTPFLMLTKHGIIIDSERGEEVAKKLITCNPMSANILADLNVKYVVLHKDANWPYIKGHPDSISDSYRRMKKSLDNIPYLEVEETMGNLTIYRNMLWSPVHMYPAESIDDSATAKMNNSNFQFKKVDRVHFKANASSDEEFYLVLLENYDKGWEATVDGVQLNESTINVQGFNVWRIPAGQDIDIEVIYKPQKWFIVGLCISSVALVIVISIIIMGLKNMFRWNRNISKK